MLKTIVFVHRRFKNLEVFISEEENKHLVSSSSYGGMIEICDLFEYLRYAKVDEEIRWDFEEWISEIILDCAKLI